MNENSQNRISIREGESADGDFLELIARRLNPDPTTSPRDPEILSGYFAQLTISGMLTERGMEVFVAAVDDRPVGVVAVHPDTDHFTGHPRVYVDILVVLRPKPKE